MNDEQFFLANAYLDGELTADERAIAEADPAVMAEVEELRVLQALIRDVDPPSATVREDAIAAAMAEFGTAGAAAASTPASSTASTGATAPIPFRPRPAYAKYLAVAAGVLGVGLLGVAVANLPGGGDDSAEDSAAQPAAEEPASEPASGDADRLPETLSEDAADEAADDGGDAADDAPAAEMATADEPTEMPAEEPASEPAEEPAAEPADEPADEDVAPRPALAPDQVLTSPDELGSFGTGLLEQQLDGTLPPTPNHACDVDDVLGTAEYLAGDVQRTVLVAVDEAVDLVLAFDQESCEYVAQGPLYEPFGR